MAIGALLPSLYHRGKMNTLYIDKDIIVCEKPYGVSSQASDKENMLDIILSEHGVSAFVIHRLDVTTEGLMVYALNERSASVMGKQIAEGKLHKQYLAIVHSATPDEGEMIDVLYHDKTKNKSFVVDKERKGAKRAHLRFETVARTEHEGQALSLVKITLLTGRTHQIRVQFSSRGFVLFGDGKYGARDKGKIALYSHSLGFSHPKSGKGMSFCSYPNIDGAWCAFKEVLTNKQ